MIWKCLNAQKVVHVAFLTLMVTVVEKVVVCGDTHLHESIMKGKEVVSKPEINFH